MNVDRRRGGSMAYAYNWNRSRQAQEFIGRARYAGVMDEAWIEHRGPRYARQAMTWREVRGCSQHTNCVTVEMANDLLEFWPQGPYVVAGVIFFEGPNLGDPRLVECLRYTSEQRKAFTVLEHWGVSFEVPWLKFCFGIPEGADDAG